MVNCKWCGTPTSAEFTQECDRCWELHWRIEDNPQVALQMLAQLTPLALDGGDSAALQALSTPEVLFTLQGESNPAHRK